MTHSRAPSTAPEPSARRGRSHPPSARGRRAPFAPAPFALALATSLGCQGDLDRFDTGEEGAYCGNIVDGAFIRRGFPPGVAMRLTLDIEALEVSPGRLSTDDASSGPCSPAPTFDAAPLRVTPEIFADPISLLEFGQAREHNFLAWVDPECGQSALAVVSLLHDRRVEVRLMRPGAPATNGEFGVFLLTRTDCTF